MLSYQKVKVRFCLGRWLTPVIPMEVWTQNWREMVFLSKICLVFSLLPLWNLLWKLWRSSKMGGTPKSYHPFYSQCPLQTLSFLDPHDPGKPQLQATAGPLARVVLTPLDWAAAAGLIVLDWERIVGMDGRDSNDCISLGKFHQDLTVLPNPSNHG